MKNNKGFLENYLFRLFSSKGTLSQRVLQGGILIFLSRIIERILILVKVVILARLLMPHDFGLMGVCMLAIAVFETFSLSGFDEALIQRENETDKFLDTAWTVSAMRGLVLFLTLYFSSGIIARFFKAPDGVIYLQLAALSMVFSGFTNIGIIYFRKELEFHKQFIYQVVGILAELLIAIPLAFIFRNVIALVLGFLAKNITRFTLSYIIHPYRPKFVFTADYAKELYRFGRWIFATGVILFLATQGSDIFLGKFLGVTALGFYQIAYYFSNMPSTEITEAISSITFPAYSKIQSDLLKLKDGFIRTLRFTGFISIPLAAGIFIMAPEITRIFLGEKWTPVIPVLRILSVSGLIRSLIAIAGPLFCAVGQPKTDFKIHSLRVITMAVSIYPLTIFLGMSGVAIAILIGLLSTIPVWVRASIRIIRIRLTDYLDVFLPTLGATLLATLFVFFIKKNMTINNIMSFSLIAVIFVLLYLTFMYCFWRIFKIGPVQDLQFLKQSL